MNIRVNFEKKIITLKNGFTLILCPDQRIPLVSFFLKVKNTGSKNEGEYLGSGISHFIEHTLFLGSKKFPYKDQFSNYLEKKGAADFNAYTTYDHTAFYFSIFSKFLPQVILNFFDFVFNPLFPPREVENERGTILSEMNISEDNYNDFFYHCLLLQLGKKDFSKYPIIGIKKIFNQVQTSDLNKFHQRNYVPENMVLSLVGNFKIKKVEEIVLKFFNSSPNKRKWKKSAVKLSTKKKPSLKLNYQTTEFTHPQVIFPKISLVFSAANFYQREKYAFEIINYLLGSGEGSVLYEQIKEKKDLVQSINSNYLNNPERGNFSFNFVLNEIKTNHKLKKEIFNIIQEIFIQLEKINNFITSKKLEGAKSTLINDFFETQENLMDIGYNHVFSYEHYGHLDYQKKYTAEIRQVSLQKIFATIKKFLSKKKYQLFLLLPRKNFSKGKILQNSIVIKDNQILEKKLLRHLTHDLQLSPYLSCFPKLKSKASLPLLRSASDPFFSTWKKKFQIKKITLHPNQKMIIAKNHNSPLINLVLRYQGGQQFESNSSTSTRPSGLFYFFSKLLFASNQQFSKEKLLSLIRENAIQFFSKAGEDSLTLGFSCLREKYLTALEIFKSIINNNCFYLKEVKLEEKNHLFLIKKNQERADNLAILAFKKEFFKNLIYSYPLMGTINSFKQIKTSHLNKLLSNFKKNRKVLSVMGLSPLDTEIIETQKVFEAFNSVSSIPPQRKKLKIKLCYQGSQDLRFTYHPNIQQTHIHLGFYAPIKFSPDELVFKVIESYLTGLGGPLFKLRSKGYSENGQQMGGRAYSLGAYYKASLEYGAMIFYTSLGKESKDEYHWMISAFLEVIRKLKEEKISNHELNRARNTLLSSFYKNILRSYYLTNLYSLYEYNDLDLNQWKEDYKKIPSIKASEVQEIAKKYFLRDNFIVHVMISK